MKILAAWPCVPLLAFLAGLPSSLVRAQLPQAQLWAIAPAGGRQGADVGVRITAGADLERVDRMIFSHPGIKAVHKPGAPLAVGLPPEVTRDFVVSIAADVPVGQYDVRAVGAYGVSNPRTFVVSDRPELIEESDNRAPDRAMRVPVNTVVNGSVTAATTDYFRFEAEANTRIIVDLAAQRIDSRLDSRLTLFDPSGRELKRSRDVNRRDPLIDFTVPAKGDYTIAVTDLLYNGGDEYFYRLSIGNGPYIDYVLPMAAVPGMTSKCTLFGRNLPGGQPVTGQNLERLEVDISFPQIELADALAGRSLIASQEAALDGFEYRFSGPAGKSNPVLLGFARTPVVLEHEPNDTPDQPQLLSLPVEVDGQLFPAGNVDWYQFSAQRGKVYQIEIVAQKLGHAADPQLVLQRVKREANKPAHVTDIAEIDDERELGDECFSTASGDASYRFVVPDDGEFRLMVRDLNSGTSDPRRVYRLIIREPAPDFRVLAVTGLPKNAAPKQGNQAGAEAKPWGVLLRRGGRSPIHLIALRRDGFDGPVEVVAEGLPPGVTCPPVTLGGGQEDGELVFQAADDAPAWVGTIRIVGRAAIGGQTVSHIARAGVPQWPNRPQRNQAGSNRLAEARLMQDLALAVTEEELSPLTIEAGTQSTVEVSRAGKLEIPVRLVRRGGFKEAVTVTVDGPKNLFKSQPVTIAAGANEGKVAIEIAATAPLGLSSLVLSGATKYSYARDPQSAKAAADLKKQIDERLSEAAKSNDDNLKKSLEAAKTVVAKRSEEANKAAAAKDTAVVVPSNVLAIVVKPAPVEIDLPMNELAVKLSTQVESPITLRRLFDFAEQVELEVVLPNGLSDVKATAPTIAKGNNEGKLTIAVGPKASVGSHGLVLRAKPKLNGQTLTVERAVTIKIE